MKQNKSRYKLCEITQIVSGGTPSTRNDEYYNGDIPWITPKDLSGYQYKYIKRGERNITLEGLNNSSAKMIPKGSVLFSSRAPIGYVAIAENDLCTNQGFKSFICNEKYINNQYLYYYLLSNKDEIEKMANGSTFKELSVANVKALEVSIPDIKYQNKIVEKLSLIESKIELNLNIIDTLHKLSEKIYIKYYENANIEGTYIQIGDIIDIISGATPKTSKEEYWYNGDIQWFTPSDITSMNSIFVCDSSRKITKDGFDNSSTKKIPPYSILMTSRATIGEIAINIKEVTTNQGIMAMVPNEKISLYELYFWLRRSKNIIISISNGSTFKEISKRELKKLQIFRPNEKNINAKNILKGCFKKIELLINENNLLKNLLSQLLKEV